jgi:predicted AAA+ superfamily ATPase
MDYLPRVADQQLARTLTGLPAVIIDGAKAVGKTATAGRAAGSAIHLDDPAELAVLQADRASIENLAPPVLIDEWQLDQPIWDAVRRSVDANRAPGRFILTGSANPRTTRIHSGAGRMVHLRMRPMSLSERTGQATPVSFAALAAGTLGKVDAAAPTRLDGYVDEILASGLPGIRSDPEEFRPAQIDSYITDAVSKEMPALGAMIRRPAALRSWLAAYAAATSTTTSLEKIASAVSPDARPARSTIEDYREALTQLWLLDELPAWAGDGRLRALTHTPKRHLADPALACRLLRATRSDLLSGRWPRGASVTNKGLVNGPLVGALFESLVTLSVRVLAEAVGADVSHLRTHRGEREVDLVVETSEGGLVAIEVKLAQVADEAAVAHLNWFGAQFPDRMVDRVVINTGPKAYRRTDGVLVLPLALLGP